jgi:hypothetical protein
MRNRRILSTLSVASAVAGLLSVYSCGSSKGGGAPPGGNPDGGPGPGNDGSPGTDSPAPPPNDSSTGDSPATGGDTGPGSDSAVPANGSVLMHHNTPQRDGLYIDPAFTTSYAMGLTHDTNFDGAIVGNMLSQPLYVANISAGKDAVFVATESDNIYSLDATTGAVNWMTNVGTPVNQANDLPCGGGITTYGITGTPIIDMTARLIYAESFYLKGGSGGTVSHQVVALSIDTGMTKGAPWPIQIDATTTPNFPGAIVEHARGALALVNGILYIPYSGLNGDCNGPNGNPVYHGGIVGIDTANPTTIKSWFTSAAWGGSWGTSGIPSDGTNVYLTTGNTTGANNVWGGGEAVLRFSSGPTYASQTFANQTANYFAPHDWQNLDNGDTDLGSTEAILINVPGATPSQLIFAGGKGQEAYLISQANMGGITANDGVANAPNIVGGEIKTAFAAYTTAMGSYVVLSADGGGNDCPNGTSGNLVALKISATNPPQISTAWCANPNGSGSPMVTTTDGSSDAIVWIPGATGSNQLYGFNGDTGATIFGGGGFGMQGLEHWITPMEAKGKIFVAGDGKVYAFQ